MQTQQSKLIAPWEFTYQEFFRDTLYHPIGEPWEPQYTNPFNRPMLFVNDPNLALNYTGRSGRLLFIDAPTSFIEQHAIRDHHPTYKHPVIGFNRNAIATLRDRVGVIPVAPAEQEPSDVKEIFTENPALQKWHFTQVVKAFMSGQYVPLKVMLNYSEHLSRWASKQKAFGSDRYLRLPHSISKKQHGRDDRKERKLMRIESAQEEWFIGEFDDIQQSFGFSNARHLEQELQSMIRDEQQMQAVNTKLTKQNQAYSIDLVHESWSKAIHNEQRIQYAAKHAPKHTP